MAGVSIVLMTVVLAAAVAGVVAIMLLLLVGSVRLEAARQARSRTSGTQLHSTAWANQVCGQRTTAWSGALIGATGDDTGGASLATQTERSRRDRRARPPDHALAALVLRRLQTPRAG